jgi:replication factor C subunit 1
VPDVIDFMDSYYLTKDDYDAILELGVGPMEQENWKLATATKATFTRLYNLQSHPLSFIKASSVGNPIGGKSKKEKPDLEEAVEGSEDEAVEAAEADEDEDGEIDLKKDKYIAKPKKKPAKKAGGTKTKGKGKEQDDDDDDMSEGSEDVAPKKKKAAGRGGRSGGRGRGKA